LTDTGRWGVIGVDLGASATICQVVLQWESASGKAFQIQTSPDAATWTMTEPGRVHGRQGRI
jgi:hypothetical protein